MPNGDMEAGIEEGWSWSDDILVCSMHRISHRMRLVKLDRVNNRWLLRGVDDEITNLGRVPGPAAQPHFRVMATSPGMPPGKSTISTLSLYPRGRKYFAQS